MKAVVLGGNGMVGAAVCRRLLAAGCQVVITGRDEARLPADVAAAGARFVRSDRYLQAELAAVLRPGADVVVDCLCYTAAHARMLLASRADVGSVVMISSKAVYVDDAGRHSNSEESPVFAGPVSEDQPTMRPSDVDHRSREGYGANKVAAEQVLLDSGLPVSVLRPSRIHGIGSERPREWVFVKRILDGRHPVLLARGGRGVNHPTAAANLGALVAFVAARPARRILNSADPDAPDGLTIARVIAAHLGHRWMEVLLGEDAPPGLGDHPWNTWPPFVLDTAAATRLGYRPVGSYADLVTSEVDWLVDAARHGDPRRLLPGGDDPDFSGYFDYAREDEWLARHRS